MNQEEVVIWTIVFYIFIFLFGLLVGSFLNVCIYRIPLKESVAKERSHCMSCGYQLAWYDLFPLFSWLALRGRCRECGAKISAQYPIVEGLNAILVVLTFSSAYGFNAYNIFENFSLETLLYCLLISALIVLSVIDFRTYEIPFKINIFIFTLGIINIAYRVILLDSSIWNLPLYILGFFAVSVPLGIIWFVSYGKAIGGGDVKLMAAAGLLIGWKLILLALVVGCVVGSIIHIARMKISKADRVLAMGPYLSVGIATAVLIGEPIVNWYFGFFKH